MQDYPSTSTIMVSVAALLASVVVALEDIETQLPIGARISKPAGATAPVAMSLTRWEFSGVFLLRLPGVPRHLTLLRFEPSDPKLRIGRELVIDMGPVAIGFMALPEPHAVQGRVIALLHTPVPSGHIALATLWMMAPAVFGKREASAF